MARLFKFLLIIAVLLAYNSGFAQQHHDSTTAKGIDYSIRVSQAIKAVGKSSRQKYDEERVALGQQRTLRNIELEIRAAKLFLKSNLDTISIQNEIERVARSFNLVKEGVNKNKNVIQTHRNLTVSSAILTQLLSDLTLKKEQLDKSAESLIDHRYKLDSLASDSLLFTLPLDSAKIMTYGKKLAILDISIGPADSLIDKTITRLQVLQARLDPLVFDLNLSIEGLETEKQEFAGFIFRREFPTLWKGDHQREEFWQTVRVSAAKEWMALRFYLDNYTGRFIVLLAVLMISMVFLKSLQKRYDEHPEPERPERPLVVDYPYLSSILIVISLFQFLFVDPPFVVSFCFWLLCMGSLTVIFKQSIAPYWFRFWLGMSALFILAALDNMILQPTSEERWLMLILSVSSAGICIYTLVSQSHANLRERYILYAIRFIIVCEIVSVFANIYGRYNLSKTLMMFGFVGLIIAILFLWTVRLIDGSLRLSNSLYKTPDRKLFYVNFDRLGDKTPSFLYVLLCIGWVILVGRNYYEFKQFIDPFNYYITEERAIGDYTFTIRDLLLFLGISGAAVVISRLISFFATEPGMHASNEVRSASSIAANWLLLIRILVITSGILLAFAATGIPFDRLTIIIGALGVGIGLGLQSLVTNLVSGLVIAFERPVGVGDNVEVNGKLGIMKSVGFRSSVIALADGSQMIVPNGDLLSQHLISWPLGRENRVLTLTVGVAYGTDLKNAKSLLVNLLTGNNQISQSPRPVVAAKAFGDSAIDFELIFWVRSADQTLTVRDEVVQGIDRIFKENGIAIPYPQQEVHIIENRQEKNKADNA